MKSNLPALKEENIIVKIKNFFMKMFKKNKDIGSKEIINKNETANSIFSNQIGDFRNRIKVNVSKINVLRNRLKNNEITVSDLSDIELDEMIEMYKKVIEEKKQKLIRYKKMMV